MIKVTNSAEFDELLEGLARNIFDANIYYKLYRDVHQALCDHPIVPRQSNTFWQLTLNAYSSTSMQSLCRAYDTHRTALHLHNWLLTIRDNPHLFEEKEFRQRMKDNPFVDSLAQAPRTPDRTILDEDIRLCSPEDPLVKTLIYHRHIQVAHTDAYHIITKRNPYEAFPLPIADFEKLLCRATEILNRYSSLFRATTYSMQIIGQDDFQFIIKYVEEKVQRMDVEE